MSLFDLTEKVSIVTGCSTGLGEAMAIALAQAGSDIVGVYNQDFPTIETKIKELNRQFLGLQADLSTNQMIPDLIHKTIQEFGKIDILVNNAGIIRRNKALEFTEKDWDDVLNVNLKSLFFLSQAVAKQMILQGHGGKIINIASLLSFQGGILVPSYTASKSAVLGLTRELACEWACYGINVNAIAPGYMITRNTEPLQKDSVRNRQILERIPANRWGEPQDLQGTVVFLASKASDYIHGSTVVVDGGWLVR